MIFFSVWIVIMSDCNFLLLLLFSPKASHPNPSPRALFQLFFVLKKSLPEGVLMRGRRLSYCCTPPPPPPSSVHHPDRASSCRWAPWWWPRRRKERGTSALESVASTPSLEQGSQWPLEPAPQTPGWGERQAVDAVLFEHWQFQPHSGRSQRWGHPRPWAPGVRSSGVFALGGGWSQGGGGLRL